MKSLFWKVQAGLFFLGTLAVALLPERSVASAGWMAGTVMRLILPSRRRIAEDNIRRALPHMRQQPEWTCPLETAEEITREVFIRIGTSLVETCRLYHGKAEELINTIEIRGMEHHQAARAKGKGIIFLTGHCGNWELMALAYSRPFSDSMSVVARRQNNPYLNRMVEKMRMHYRNQVIYKENAMRSMLAVIRKNGTIGLLVDQAVLESEGVLIPFLGRTAWASKAPVILARKTGAAILPAFIHREAGRHVITLYPECVISGDDSDKGLAADVKRYSECIERFIIAHPADWYWVHRRWKRAGEVADAA